MARSIYLVDSTAVMLEDDSIHLFSPHIIPCLVAPQCRYTTARLGTYMSFSSTRNIIDVRQRQWKHGGGLSTNVMFVSWDVSRQGDGNQTVHSRAGALAV